MGNPKFSVLLINRQRFKEPALDLLPCLRQEQGSVAAQLVFGRHTGGMSGSSHCSYFSLQWAGISAVLRPQGWAFSLGLGTPPAGSLTPVLLAPWQIAMGILSFYLSWLRRKFVKMARGSLKSFGTWKQSGRTNTEDIEVKEKTQAPKTNHKQNKTQTTNPFLVFF